jgi:hypothetical protein
LGFAVGQQFSECGSCDDERSELHVANGLCHLKSKFTIDIALGSNKVVKESIGSISTFSDKWLFSHQAIAPRDNFQPEICLRGFVF